MSLCWSLSSHYCSLPPVNVHAAVPTGTKKCTGIIRTDANAVPVDGGVTGSGTSDPEAPSRMVNSRTPPRPSSDPGSLSNGFLGHTVFIVSTTAGSPTVGRDDDSVTSSFPVLLPPVC